ncbi:enolase 2-phosphoglycerate dehydratase [Ophiobolus disseminans]|uniref:Enolase 2-phosphoglycerate dehydratase n=1 Tax=Ophiobolus disseminans TaxID=1469910 RepID=A0A6A7A5T1_9PLEO|nr:enolase 2-phosphoglycerate dehydratase [Ophiobolus disseminans]
MAASMSDLTIARIDVFHVDLPYANGVYHLSLGRQYTSFAATVVRITTQNGIEGWGESTPFGATYIAAHALGVRAGITEIAPKLIGLDPRRVDRINDAMDAALVGHEHAKTALDVACWDVFGKSVGLPVCELLGGRTETSLPRISSIGVCKPEEMRELVAGYRAKGYTGHSIKIGGDPSADAALITAALADKQPGEFFLADANCGLTVERALRMLRQLPSGLDFVLESPCATWRENISLRRRTDVPIIFDELATDTASVVNLIADDGAEGINLKISKCGGLTKGRRIRDICLAAGYTMSVQDCWGSDISFAAIAHLAQTIPSDYLRCILDVRSSSTISIADGKYLDEDDGGITVSTAPGLGITPRLDVLGEPIASYS